MSNSDEMRMLPLITLLHEGEASIVETTTHAKASSCMVESHQRQQHHVKLIRRKAFAAAELWLCNAKVIACRQLLRLPGCKQQAATVDDRNMDMTLALQRRCHEGLAVDFTVYREITRDALGSGHEGQGPQCPAHTQGMITKNCGGQGCAPLAHG